MSERVVNVGDLTVGQGFEITGPIIGQQTDVTQRHLENSETGEVWVRGPSSQIVRVKQRDVRTIPGFGSPRTLGGIKSTDRVDRFLLR